MENTKKRSFIYLPIVFAVILIIGIYLGIQITPGLSSDKNNLLSLNRYDKFTDVINYIQKEYVDSTNREQLTEVAISSMLLNLDPHSVYIPALKFDAANDPLEGNFDGIGVQFRIIKDTIMVINPVSGGPSEKVGIRAGDRIVKVDGELVAGKKITNNDVMKWLKGSKGSKVVVGIYRRGIRNLIDFTIIRDKIPTYSVDISYMVNNNIGYIKVNKFSVTTHKEFHEALEKLTNSGMTKLILDLRGNPGGYMGAAVKMADEFLEKNKLIVYTKGRRRKDRQYFSTNSGLFKNNEVVVLLDEWSASASEIVAGAIQDNDRGVILGRRSFGKGLVQEQLNLHDGSAIRLTVARYYTPTGRCIQKPYDNGSEKYYHEFYERILKGDLENPDSLKFADSLKFKTKNGKTVYGGGGIMPDIFIPNEVDSSLRYFNLLVNKGIIYQFAFNYTDKNRNELGKYNSFESFNKRFIVDEKLLNKLYEFASKSGIKKDIAEALYAQKRIKIRLKAFISRNLFDYDGFYPIFLTIDKTFLRAVKELEK